MFTDVTEPDNKSKIVNHYIQETGRVGRDGRPAIATLLKARNDHPVDDDIKEYVANSSMYRQDTLFGNTDNYTPLSVCVCHVRVVLVSLILTCLHHFLEVYFTFTVP